jgi:hypothetical protein
MHIGIIEADRGERDYHLRRSQAEREFANLAADRRASDAHMRLCGLHLSRAFILEEVSRRI